MRAEGLRLQGRAPDNMGAYDLLLRGQAYMHKLTPENTTKALECFERAIELDPNYGRAYAFASWCYRRDAEQRGVSFLPEKDRRKLMAYARQALRCDRNDPFVLIYVAAVYLRIEGHLDEALTLIDRAIAMNPYSHRFSQSKGQLI